jgi:tripartite-type tricarboxylate transporter receptor subunit TctC
MKLLKTLVATAFIVGTAHAADTTEFTVAFGPGGPSDITTRIIAKELNDPNMIVVNRPGAGGRIAIKKVLEGNAMLLSTMSQTFVTNPMMFDKLEYDPVKDIKLIGLVASMPSALVCNASKNIKTVADLDKTSNLTFGFAGFGSSEHLATEVLLKKVKTQHRPIPYSKGGASALQDLMSGNIDCMFANYPTVRGYVTNDKLTVVMTSHDLGLGVPTWKDVYKENFPFQSYLGLIVSSTMDKAKQDKLIADLSVVFKKPEFIEGLKAAGLFPAAGTDSTAISTGLHNNVVLRNLIVNNNIKLQ